MTSGSGRRLAASGAGRRSWLAETSWPYGMLAVAMLFGLGLFLLGVTLQEYFRPRVDVGARLEAWVPVAPRSPVTPIPRAPFEVASVTELREAFAGFGYDVSVPDAPMAGVPPLALSRFPEDLGALPDTTERKRLFVQSVLPMVLMANRSVRRVRAQVEAVAGRLREGGALDEDERAWLDDLALRYGSPNGDTDELLARLDEVPVSIALAQAAIESGWGTSRFAREGNALFGARTWRDDVDGMIPEARAEGERFRVRRYLEPAESVFSYLHNLNSSPVYAEWRSARAAQRAASREAGMPEAPLTAASLLDGLEAYAETGADYVALIGKLIEDEALHRFAGARLADPAAERQFEAAAGPAPAQAAETD